MDLSELNLEPSLIAFLQTWSRPVYLVGGAVRDLYLGRPCHDFDFAVDRGAIRLTFAVARAFDLPAFALDQERDVGRVIFPDSDRTLDFAVFRAEAGKPHPSLEEDLRARDFTINAMALPINSLSWDSLIDPCSGSADLQASILRQTNPESIATDPARALRAVRLAATFNLEIAPESWQAVCKAGESLGRISAERIRDELLKLLATPRPDETMRRLHQCGLLAAIVPEVAPIELIEQSAPHRERVLDHSFSVLGCLAGVENCVRSQDSAEPHWQLLIDALQPYAPRIEARLQSKTDGGFTRRELLRLAALLHDTGKATTATIDENGRIRFFGHEQISQQLAESRMQALRFSREAIAGIATVVEMHMRPLLLLNSAPLTRRAVYRYFQATGEWGIETALHASADALSKGVGAECPHLVNIVGELCRFYYEEHNVMVAPRPLVGGKQLMAYLQIGAGKEIGRLLALLKEAQATGEVTTVEEAFAFARVQLDATQVNVD